MSDPGHSSSCLNCGAELIGQYCGQCGQRATGRLISLWELLRDAFGDLFELDSRLWRTLVPLLIKPGKLTKDYLEGRRARYMPPFRMYLVLSLVFFAVAFFDPADEFAILYEPPTELSDAAATATATDTVTQEELDARLAETRTQGREAIEQLIADGILAEEDIPEKLTIELREPDADATAEPEQPAEYVDESAQEDAGEDNDVIINFSDSSGDSESCTLDDFNLGSAPQWLQKRFTKERVVAACERVKDSGGKSLANAIVAKIPAALIILLPFLAFVLKTLYPLSRRYYVEHLLFFVHFHAFFFLILSLQILLSRLGTWIGFAGAFFTLLVVAASFYIPVYLFIAMRCVYGQGRLVSLLKFIWLAFWYLVGFTFVMLGATLIAVFAI